MMTGGISEDLTSTVTGSTSGSSSSSETDVDCYNERPERIWNDLRKPGVMPS